VNSANVTDPATGDVAINLPIDVVSSVQVISNPYDPAYGKFTGTVSFQNFAFAFRLRVCRLCSGTRPSRASMPSVNSTCRTAQNVARCYFRNSKPQSGMETARSPMACVSWRRSATIRYLLR
jgi:hypothetical protein